MDWSCVNYLWIIVMHLSAVWTLTAPIPCRGSIPSYVMLNFSKSVPKKKQTHLHFGSLRVSKFSANSKKKKIMSNSFNGFNLKYLLLLLQNNTKYLFSFIHKSHLGSLGQYTDSHSSNKLNIYGFTGKSHFKMIITGDLRCSILCSIL